MSTPAGWVAVPTEPGLYYYRVWGSSKNRVAEVWLQGETLVATTMEAPKSAAEFCRWWWGPLLPPVIEPPKTNPMESR